MKIALITGARQGLGQGFVQALSAKGYFVYAGDRTGAQNHPAKNVTSIRLDVQDDASILYAIGRIKAEQGALDLLINNAGLNKDTATGGHPEKAGKLASLDRSVLLAMFDTNAAGPLMLAKAAAPLMTSPGSFIINISSERASFANDTNIMGNYGYRASKVALNMFTRCLLFDLPPNISTFAVHPGWVHTAMNPHGVLEPRAAAEQILEILKHWKPEQNGRFLNNDGSPYPL